MPWSRMRWTASCARSRRSSRASTSSGARPDRHPTKSPALHGQSGASSFNHKSYENLFDNLDDAPRAGLDQHRTIVDDGVAVSRRSAVFRGNVVVGHAAFRQHDAYANVIVIPIRRPPLTDHIFAKARAIVDPQDAA